jgi:hypothetical protein
MSVKNRLERKKYMWLCRWGQSRFPNTVTRYTNRNNPKEDRLQFWISAESHEMEF